MPPISILDIDDLKDRLKRAEEAINYDIELPKQSIRVLDQLEPEVQPFVDEITEPVDYSPYARIAEQAYKKDRVNTDRYIYDKELSTPDYGVYEGVNEYVIGIRGSSPETPVRDFIRDAQVALGSVSTLTGMNFVGKAVDEVDELVKKLKSKSKKKISLSGHSLGGSIASYFGVDNPDVDVYTFNKGEGLPFITDAVKCSIYGCSNIKNYRIAGDFASLGSKLGNIGTYETLRPVKPTPEVQEEAQLAGGYFIEPEFYLPHSISNFVGRDSKVKLNSNIYARPLAGKIGKVAGSVLPIVGGIAYNKYVSSLGEDALERLSGLERGAIGQAINEYIRDIGLEEPTGEDVRMAQLLETQITDKISSSFKNTLTQLASGTVLGRSAGELAGLAFYEAFLKE
jgi:hypothetical protein